MWFSKEMEGWVWDRFQVTVPMSTYLLAFLVSELEYEPSPRVASNNVAFRVWARKDAVKTGQVKFAAEIGPKVRMFKKGGKIQKRFKNWPKIQ